MKYLAFAALALSLVPAAASADPYPTTLNQEEQERHEFLDAQRGAPAGVRPSFGRHHMIPAAPRATVRQLETRQGAVPDAHIGL
jgi:hypothetical protein